MTDQDILPTLTATFPLWRNIMIREGIEIVHTHQATSVMSNESVVYASALGLPSVFTDHSLFQFDDLAGVILNRVLETTLGATLNAAICVSHACRENLILRAKLDPNKIDVAKALHLSCFQFDATPSQSRFFWNAAPLKFSGTEPP